MLVYSKFKKLLLVWQATIDIGGVILSDNLEGGKFSGGIFDNSLGRIDIPYRSDKYLYHISIYIRNILEYFHKSRNNIYIIYAERMFITISREE